LSASSPLIALLVLVVAAPPAIARDDGVSVDPDSPAGVEYAVPLDQARRDATGTAGGGSAGTDHGQPLFGVGIERASAGSGGGGGAKGSGGSGRSAGTGGSSGGGTQAGAGEAGRNGASAAAIEVAASGGSSTGMLSAGIAGGVLLLGLLGGLGLRRVLRDN
jgi:hypothetical protein